MFMNMSWEQRLWTICIGSGALICYGIGYLILKAKEKKELKKRLCSFSDKADPEEKEEISPKQNVVCLFNKDINK